MALQSTVANLKDMLHKITQDIQKAEGWQQSCCSTRPYNDCAV